MSTGGPALATRRLPDAPASGGGWYDVLLDPVRDRVEAAWRRIPGGPSAPEAVPRAGLGGAVVAHVARGWGTRRWQEAGRVAVAVVEAANQRVFLGAPEADTRAAWLAADLRGVVGVARRVARRDEALLRRVAARLMDGPAPGAERVPEAVIFLRGAVAAGVLAGDVPDAVHARLDAWAVALGEGIEAAEAGDTSDTPDTRDTCDTRDTWREAARAALDPLPDADARERMLAVLDPGPRATNAPREPRAWEPAEVPLVALPDDPLARAMDAALVGEGPLRAAARWQASLGGKRVRARIAMAAARAVGASPDVALPAAAAVEWVHAASLVLDDIVDEADLRRGAPALHHATSAPFAAGTAAWILARVGLADPALVETMLALAEGQRAELARAGDLGMSRADWYAIAAAKTARLFAAAATAGGRAANATPAHLRALGRYGQELGLAFQIVDDLLDLVGDEAQLGKRPGQDLRTGRVTFPLLVLRDHAPDAIGDPSRVLEAMARHDVAAACRARAHEHVDRALAALTSLPGETSELAALATLCVERRA